MATILILDDRATNREFLITLLRYAGHTLLEAADAETALALAIDTAPNLVITDVLMPDVDGFEFVRRLRADPAIAYTRVIFYTATYIESETRVMAQALGVTHLLTKPSEPQIILRTVEAALGAPAPAGLPLPVEAFAQEHQRLLLDKLGQKVDQLEALNTELEERVEARTAELAAANTRLRELNAVKDNLVAITSHDLRSPLGAIQNMAELLIDEMELTAEARHMVQQIDESTRHLIALVTNMLDLSKLEAGKVVLEPIPLRVSDIARRSLEALRASAQAKKIVTQLVVDPAEPLVEADWLKLSQIMTNLLSNAIKFTPLGGQVNVSVGPDSGGVYVGVADSGIGIPAHTLPRVFEQFRQAHTRGTANERGTGLGLAIVRQLVELHGGTIEVASVEGNGSTFSVHLPASSAES
jgi:signal transduction histidine kinase